MWTRFGKSTCCGSHLCHVVRGLLRSNHPTVLPADTTEEEDPNSDLFEGLLDDDNRDADKVKGSTAAPPGHTAKAAKAAVSEVSSPPCSSWEEMMRREEEEEGEDEEEEEEEDECVGASEISSVQYDHLHQVWYDCPSYNEVDERGYVGTPCPCGPVSGFCLDDVLYTTDPSVIKLGVLMLHSRSVMKKVGIGLYRVLNLICMRNDHLHLVC